MANKNFDHVSHIKSRLPRETEEGEFYGLTPTADNSEAEGSSPIKLNLAKRPTAENLIEGEIAVNYLKGHETLTIKNTEDEIVAFVNENDFNEAQEIVALGLAQEKDERVNDIARLDSRITDEIGDKLDKLEEEFDGKLEEFDGNIEDLELIMSSALNDLNSRTTTTEGKLDELETKVNDEIGVKLDDLEEEVDGKFEGLDENIERLELGISSAFNDLNGRVSTLETKVNGEIDQKLDDLEDDVDDKIGALQDAVDDQFEKVDTNINEMELVISASLNDLNGRIDAMGNVSEDMVVDLEEKLNTEIENMNGSIEEMELAISSSLNDLNTRNIHLYDNLQDFKEKTTYDGHEYVDLGLPSGNLWATMNIGAVATTGTGLYFAWGETEGYADASVREFVDTEYEYMLNNSLTKYTAADKKTVLDRRDDAAFIDFGRGWRVPSQADWQELINNCQSEVISLNGVSCIKFTNNDAELYLPSCGYAASGSITNVGDGCFYWTNELATTTDNAKIFAATTNNSNIGIDTANRYYGYQIRPVFKK